MAQDVTRERAPFLSTALAGSRDRRFALVVVLISLAVFLAAVPFARTPLTPVWAFIPIYQSALAISALITANLLFVQFAMRRSRALLVLACAYLFSAAMVVPHTLTFPGLFSPGGLLGAGTQSTAWLYHLWHGGFPLFVLGYALLKGRRDELRPQISTAAAVTVAVAAVLAAVCALTALTTAGHALLPVILNDGYTPAMMALMTVTWVLNWVALVVLWGRRPHTVLDVWLMVTMCACLFDIALSAVLNAARFDFGFYAGRVYGLLAATFVLVVLLREMGVLYTQLARLLEAEQRERRRDIEERRRLFETSLDLIMVLDRNAIIRRVNPSSVPILGCAPQEMIGRHAGEFVHPEDLAASRKEMRNARRGGIIRNFECRCMRKDGRAVALSWSGLWSEPDQLHFLFGRDMTEHKLLEEKFELAVESSPSGIIMVDGRGTILLVNAETERLFGYRRAELVGRSIDMLVPPHHRAAHPRQRMAFSDNPASLAPGGRHLASGRELHGLRKDGSEFPVEIGLNPISARDGLMILSTVIDISERKRIEWLKDEFVSTVSHELRTPLTSIAASLGLLTGAAAKLPDNVARLVAIAHNNSQRLVRLINDILDIEKIESGKITFHLRPLDVLALVEQAIDANRGFAEGYGVRIRLDDASVAGDVRADSDRLMQVVTNLLSNAIKFSPTGGEVLVAIEARDGTMRISVRDHGPGIPEEFKPRVFEKFAQADASDARKKGGTGLGLSIVKQIVIRLDGNVGFEDAPGGGTIFYVDLPACAPEARGRALSTAEHGDARLLICDDYRPAAHLLAGQLAKAGFMSDVAMTGAEVVERAAIAQYLAILIDLELPDNDGISVIQRLRAQPQNRDTPIIVVSSDPMRGRDDPRSTTLDILDWFQKPVDLIRLADAIDRAVGRRAEPRSRGGDADDTIKERQTA